MLRQPAIIHSDTGLPAALCRGQDCRMCLGICGAVSHGQCGVCNRPTRYRWEAEGSVRYEGGRWWSIGSVRDDASCYEMVDYVSVSTSD